MYMQTSCEMDTAGHMEEKGLSQASGRACGKKRRDSGSTSEADCWGWEPTGLCGIWRKEKLRGLCSWADKTADGKNEISV